MGFNPPAPTDEPLVTGIGHKVKVTKFDNEKTPVQIILEQPAETTYVYLSLWEALCIAERLQDMVAEVSKQKEFLPGGF
jgi:hypothetical protein